MQSYHVVNVDTCVVVKKRTLWVLAPLVFVLGMLAGVFVLLEAQASPQQELLRCYERVTTAHALTTRAQTLAYEALSQNIDITSRCDLLVRDTFFLSDQLFQRRNLPRRARACWRDALAENQGLYLGVGGPD